MNDPEPPLSHDTPRAIELLAAARQHLLDALLPGTVGDERYSALMIANALAIVQAELEQARACPSSVMVSDAGAEMCRQFREGNIDDLLAPTLLERLRDDVEFRLSVSNPRRLDPTRP